MKRMSFFMKKWKRWAVVPALLLLQQVARAQTADGTTGLTNATNSVVGYFSLGCTLMYAIGAVSGLIGAIKVYQKWNQGDHEVGKLAAAWFGSCIFLVVVATILKGFFGV